MDRLFTKNATGIAPNGRWYAGDVNALQDAVAAEYDLAQNIGAASLALGEDGLQILRYGAGEARLSGALRTDGILRGLGGVLAGAFTSTQRDVIASGLAPYGVVILNTTTNRYEWNSGSDAARSWRSVAANGSGQISSDSWFISLPALTNSASGFKAGSTFSLHTQGGINAANDAWIGHNSFYSNGGLVYGDTHATFGARGISFGYSPNLISFSMTPDNTAATAAASVVGMASRMTVKNSVVMVTTASGIDVYSPNLAVHSSIFDTDPTGGFFQASNGRPVYLSWSSGGTVNVGNGSGTYGAIFASAFTVASDAGLKDEIKRIDDPLTKLLKLSGYEHGWSEAMNLPGRHLGLSAQDVEKVFPMLVHETTIPHPTKEGNTLTHLAVDYMKLIPVIIEALREVDKRLVTLER